MRRFVIGASVLMALVPAAIATAMSVQSPNLPDGRLAIKHSGYVDVEYNRKLKQTAYVQVYYPCRAAGPAHSKYPAYISLTSTKHGVLHRGALSGTFTSKISDPSDPKALGAVATVNFKVSDVQLSTPGLSGKLTLAVTGPATICPFHLTQQTLTPLEDIPGNS